jgi:calcineurin-like phosphoesterase family protein
MLLLGVEMSETYFTSDTHLNHFNIIEYCNRPFVSAQEMNEIIIANWNTIIRPSDTVYHLGDFGFGEQCKKIFQRLNGQKFLIIGNHDRKEVFGYGWGWVKDVYNAKIDGKNIWLSHYPHRSWPKSHRGSWHLFGHTHGRCEPYRLSFDIGVDSWGFFPVSFERVRKNIFNLEISNKEKNYVKS